MDNNSGFNQWVANRRKSGKDNSKKPMKLSGFLWWLVIFLLAWWLFSTWFSPKQEPAARNQEPDIAEDISNVPVQTIENEKMRLRIAGSRIINIGLKDYKQGGRGDESVSLLSGENEFIEAGLLAFGTAAPTAGVGWKQGSSPECGAGCFTFANGDGVVFSRTVSFSDKADYVVGIRYDVKNKSAKDVSLAPYARVVRSGGSESVAVETGGVAYVNSDVEYDDWKRLDKKSYAYQTASGFAGFADQYWETVVSADSPDQTIRMKKNGDRYQADVSAALVAVSAGGSAAFETKIFAGPRDPSALGAAAAAIPGINKTMDYGWFWFLSRPMLWALNAIHGFVLNYGVAIILLTIALRALMWPLTRKSYTSMAAMQKMQPELQRIQKLYANDKARQQMELMKLYQTHKTSPMSGCLPMLLQIPIFFALYKALLISVPMRQAGFLWISDLSAMDPFFILPIVMGATMWWQQNLQSAGPQRAAANDPMAQTQRIMKWMPLIFTAMFAWMPAGLVLYWTVSNLFGIGQMYVIKRGMKN